MPIATVPDHVAAAGPSIGQATVRWRDELGGGWRNPGMSSAEAGFAARQLTFTGGAVLELLEPVGTSFASRFLARRGAGIHHVTLKVDDLLDAVEVMRGHGYDVLDVFAEGDLWHEAFLRPSQIGGMVVQLAWPGRTEQEWAELSGVPPQDPRSDAARLLGPTLTHPDLDRAATIWRDLGAKVASDGEDAIVANWAGSPLDVRIEPGPGAGPVGLRLAGSRDLPADDRCGPRVLAVR